MSTLNMFTLARLDASPPVNFGGLRLPLPRHFCDRRFTRQTAQRRSVGMLTVPRWWCPLSLPRQPGVRAWAPRTLESRVAQIQAGVVVSTARRGREVRSVSTTQDCVAALLLEAYGPARAMLYPKKGGRPAKKARAAKAGALSACTVIRVIALCAGGIRVPTVAADALYYIYIFVTAPLRSTQKTRENHAQMLPKKMIMLTRPLPTSQVVQPGVLYPGGVGGRRVRRRVRLARGRRPPEAAAAAVVAAAASSARGRRRLARRADGGTAMTTMTTAARCRRSCASWMPTVAASPPCPSRRACLCHCCRQRKARRRCAKQSGL